MITKKTIFILGAGASYPYNYPTGPELRTSITEMVDYNEKNISNRGVKATKGTLSIQAMHEDYSESLLKQFLIFRKSLEDSSRSSIDTFLENRPEFCDIGKRSIAWNLLKCEYKEINNKRDWFEYLHDQELAKDCNSLEDYCQNNIDFITFNYDRLLEHNLITRLKGTYGNVEEECAEMIQDNFSVVHLHGKLNDLDWESEKGRAYGKKPNSQSEWKNTASGINIIHEKMEKKPFKQAIDLIENAEMVVFLGLNLYNTVNLDRLDISNNLEGKRIYATLKGLTRPQKEAVDSYFDNKILNSSIHISRQRPQVYNYGSLELLQQEVKFRN